MVRNESIIRAGCLDAIASNNNRGKIQFASGIDYEIENRILKNKKRILKYYDAAEKDWQDYYWQMENRITNVDTLNNVMQLDNKRYNEIKYVSQKNLWSISPYYLSLINFDDILDPLGLIAIPNILECNEEGEEDPMDEEYTSPAESITRRYPDRVILNVTNMCGVYCRFCQRKRNFKKNEVQKDKSDISEALRYISENPNIRDVLITGGDPLTLSTQKLERIISSIRAIKHVEIIRIGTRIPVTIPQRINSELVDMLKKYHPLYINLHFNHPREITEESIRACKILSDAGIPLGNQSVLLNGVNNNKYIFLRLNQELLKCRVRPYYIFQSKKVLGTTHFNCNVSEGMDIIEFLRGNTSGLAIPHFIINAPKGLGKVPIQWQNYDFILDDSILIKTWEGKEILYPNQKTIEMNKLYEAYSTNFSGSDFTNSTPK